MGQGKNKDVAWAAGLFSGLGTFYLHQNTPALILSTADPELAEKFYAVIEVGAIRSYPRHDHAEYHWISATPGHVRYIIDLFDPYLSANLRRKAYLLYAVDISAGFKIICKNGHIRLPENLTKGNQCKPCIALRRYWKFYLAKNTDTIVEE